MVERKDRVNELLSLEGSNAITLFFFPTTQQGV